MKRVGVKYCGGCNPAYDRHAAFETIREGVRASAAASGAEATFEKAEEGVIYDALLVICGCANRCASTAQYQSKTAPVVVWDANGAGAASERLARLIGEDNNGLERIL
jgi:hypothetical protein